MHLAMSTSPGSPDRRWSYRRSISQANPLGTALQTVTRLAAALLTVASATASWAGTTFDWKGGSGKWEDAASWGGALPSRTAEARINGTQDKPRQVILADANVLVNHLSVADGGNSLASMILDGPSLTVIGTVDVAKYDGSEGRLAVTAHQMKSHVVLLRTQIHERHRHLGIALIPLGQIRENDASHRVN